LPTREELYHNAERFLRDDDVPAAVLEEAFHESGLSHSELARRLAWTHPDTQRVKRALGTKRDPRTKSEVRLAVRYETAVKLIRAMGLDPVDYGL
jgi:hypothetical protein